MPDSFKTCAESSGDTLVFEQLFQDQMMAVVMSDAYLHLVKNKSEVFSLICYKSDSIVLKERYVVGGNDCHISLIEGRTLISL